MGQVTVLSVRVLYCGCNEVCGTLVGVCVTDYIRDQMTFVTISV